MGITLTARNVLQRRLTTASCVSVKRSKGLVIPWSTKMRTIIHVNQHIIKANTKNGTNLPALTVKTYKTNVNCHTAEILGPSVVVHSPHKPLSCGARVWIETEAEVVCTVEDYPEIEDEVVVELPKRAPSNSPRHEGWNACLDEVIRLNQNRGEV
jgi:hypothetical protein